MAAVSYNLLEGMLVVRTPYNPEFVLELKVGIPPWERKFNPVDKTWLVAVNAIGPLVGLLLKYWGGVTLGDHLPPSVHVALAAYVEKQDDEWLRMFEEAAMAATSKAEVIYAWGFPSRREGPSAVNYEVLLRKDGTLSCNCPGWVFNKLRTCGHTRTVLVLVDHDSVGFLLRQEDLHGGSRWMGDQDQAPKPTGAVVSEAGKRVGRRYVSHEG